MPPIDRKQGLLVNVAILATLGGVFWADLHSPLGIVVWVFYLIPVTLSVFSLQPRTPVYVATACSVLLVAGMYLSPGTIGAVDSTAFRLNRTFALLTVWAVALVSYRFVIGRISLMDRDWVRDGQRQLSARMQGEQGLHELSDTILRFLCEYLDAPVGVMYAAEESAFRRTATFATMGAVPPDLLRPGEGLAGQAVRERRTLLVRDIPRGTLPIAGSFARVEPAALLVVPALVGDAVPAVLEFGWPRAPDPVQRELLEAVSESIAVAVLSSQYRTQLRQLLDETQRQAEELRKQQHDLRVANEELEQQSQVLQESQTRLESQQSDLEMSNIRLKEQAELLATQRDALALAKSELTDQADALMRTNRYKSEFLANMSHELRTPLNSSLILAKLLADNKPGNLTREQIKFAQTIYDAGNDLLALINDVLDLSRIESGRVELNVQTVRLEQILEPLRQTFEPVATQKKLSFQASAANGVPSTMRTDPQRLLQILRNLLSNAFKFTDRGEVSLTVIPSGEARVAFVVRDTGVGIPADKLEVIFEAFRQADGGTHRKFGGTGLGLSIARDLARRMAGEVHVQSTPGRGTTFSLVTPVQLPEPEAGEFDPQLPPPRRQPPALAGGGNGGSVVRVVDDREKVSPGDRSVLIIEDDVRFAGVLQDLAHERNFTCMVATTAAEGLQLASERRPGAVLLDIHLPDESGLSVLEKLKHNPATRHIPVHAVSVDDHGQRALEMGAVGYALKPVKREELVEAFRRLEHRLDQPLRRVLLVDDSETQRESLRHLLESEHVQVMAVGTAGEALVELERWRFDCMVLDLGLPDLSGYQLLERMAERHEFSSPPVIVYTGRTLDPQQELRLRRYSHAVVIKGARSPERLLDEVTLFLHRVESTLPGDQQRMLREVRSRESVFDGRTILLAEDDVRNIFALSSAIEPRGAKLRIARNGREALQAVAEADGPRGIDLVLMDVMMPEMDGLEATREIRKLPGCGKLPIIALTAKAMPEDRQKCLDAGANDYIAKPIDLEQLLSLLRVWIPK
jgi:CheY-like chemotaxis protein